MATVYTPEKTYAGITFRAKIDYTVQETAEQVVISISQQIQYKGTYKSTGALNDGTAYNRIEGDGIMEFVLGPSYNINASGFPSKSSWTNKGSATTLTVTRSKGKTQRTAEITSTIVLTMAESLNPVKKFTVAIPALQSWDIILKNNDGTSDSFYTDKKYYGEDKAISKYDFTIPDRFGFIPRRPTSYSLDYVFNADPLGQGQEYIIGRFVYTDNAALTLYLQWDSYIYYDGNGISLTIPKQTKHEREDITLTSTIPTRVGYVFKEWNTKPDGTGDSYNPSDTYSQDGEVTLYAIWLTLPTNPQIERMTAIRSNAQGEQDDTGTYAKITVEWSVDTTSQAYPQNTGTVTGVIKSQQGGSPQPFTFSSGSSGSGGTAIALISNLDTDDQYNVTATVTDQHSSTSKTVILTRAFFIMDFKAGGQGIGIGRAAPDHGLEIGYEAFFDEDVRMYKNLTVDIQLNVPKVMCDKITARQWVYSKLGSFTDSLRLGKNFKDEAANAFEIGNGTNDNNRSNGFAVDWDGNTVASGDMIAGENLQGENCKFALDTSATSGVDKEIYDALQDLGWDGDVVSSNILTIKELLLKILTEQPLLYDSYTIPSRTYNANSTTWLYSLNYNIPEHAGYTPVGIVGVSPSQQSLLVCAPLINYRSYGRRIAGYIRNTGSSNLTDTISLSLLYVKNERLDI